MNCKNVDCKEAKLTLDRVNALRHKHYDECSIYQAGSLDHCVACKVYDEIHYAIACDGDKNRAMSAQIIEALGL